MIQIGKLFAGRYRILKSIGRGGMADVYLAKDLILDNERVAIKVLRTNYQTDQVAIARFQREARAMADLNHPNVVAIRDIGEEDGQQFLAMEYVDGADLKKYISEYAPLSNQEVVRIMNEVLSAMTLAHEHGIIHRDLKPQNILLTKDGTVKVTDFGIAVAFAETSLTQTNSMLGSVHYLSPEQARGAKATIQSDIYAMGIMLFEMLTGQIPYDGDSAVAIALKHFQNPLPSIIERNAQVPQALENVVIRATAKKLKDRYSSTYEMTRDLSTALSAQRKREKKVIFTDLSDTKSQPKLEASTAKATTEQLLKKPKKSVPPKPKSASKLVTSQKQGRSNRRLWLILAKVAFAVFVLLLLLFSLLILTKPKTVQVPNLVNQTVANAKEMIQASGLSVGKVYEEENADVEQGKIFKTNPVAGTDRREKATVDLYVSTGSEANEISLPNYVGTDYQIAVSDLVANYNVVESQISIKRILDNQYAAGTILRQTPKEGASFNTKSSKKITFEVATSDLLAMPNLVEMTYGAAVNELVNLGVASSRIKAYSLDGTTEIKNPSSSALVLGQFPYYGEQVSLSSTGEFILYFANQVTESSSTSSSSTTANSNGTNPSSSSASASDSSSSSSSKEEESSVESEMTTTTDE